MGELVSTALKYPCSRIFENTRICKKIAPPRQLKPTLWTIRPILWLNCASMVIVLPGQNISGLLVLNTYEN